MTALILSGTYTETQQFASKHQLGYGIRHIVNAANLSGRRPTSVHILPSYHTRRDIHAVRAAMKHVMRQSYGAPVFEYDLVDDEYILRADEHEPVGRLVHLEALADELDEDDDFQLNLGPAPVAAAPKPKAKPKAKAKVPGKDPSPDAVPGQTALEDHVSDEDIPDWMKS
ncbi:MAG: hypothetical protein H7288_04990 [Kineosporiaceae bacterium]|nr:hypothetical protein [Aeromicrobium sp.]